MKTNKSLMAGFAVGHGNAAAPILAIVGPLLGLVYIRVFPFVGIAAFILASGYRATQGLATMRCRATQVTIDVQEGAKAEAVGLRDFLQPIIDGLECEFVVIDRELRITHYYTPLSRQNKLLEQTAIGQRCLLLKSNIKTSY